MNEASWDRLTDAIDLKFGIARHGHEERPLEDVPDLKAQVQFVEFDRAGERYRLERITGPAIVDRRGMGSHRVGSVVQYQNVYDPTELTSRMVVLRQVGDNWDPVELADLDLS